MTRIFITGDTHCDYDWHKLNTTNFPEQKNLTKDDYVIITGDFGGVWGQDKTDKYIIKTYEKRNFTTLFVDGNHENHDALDGYPIEEWHGGKIHRISNTVIHLMRGQVYEIGGKTFFTMGGAQSTDKIYRKEGVSWWARELPSDEEYSEAISNLEKHDFKVNFIVTHCAPEDYAYYYTDLDISRKINKMTTFLSGLITEYDISFDGWYFGHYHEDIDFDNFHCLYQRVVEI
ncbi:Icc-related predicted phosphoesterase [Ruminococcaceae bacterium R-25]|nr:Icc-related predicted phosphoesterase [Ruminococcaceae bacterium R-25]SUQ21660.1 Predicted phosphoesterase [Oscillospiraceae bacterium]